MKLDAYLTLHGLSERDFARRVGVSQQAVNNYRRGRRVPAPAIMRRIYEATGGLVTPADFLDLREPAHAS